MLSAKRKIVPWTIREVNRLRTLASEQGMSAREIFKGGFFLGRSLHSLNGQMSYLGLGRPEFRERVKRGRRLTPLERTKVVDFLKDGGRHMPNSDIAEKLGIGYQSVYNYRRKLGLRLTSKESFSSKKFLETHAHVLEALRRGLKKYHSIQRATRRERLFELFRQLANGGHCKSFRQCISWGEYWFADNLFFLPD